MQNYSLKLKIIFFFAFCLTRITFPVLVHSQESIVINEILPNPLGVDKEWVELYNPTSQTINLNGWSLKDEKQVAKDVSSLNEIPPSYFVVFETEEGWLNNSGTETLTLFGKNSTPIDYIVFGSGEQSQVSMPEEGKSIGRKGDGVEEWIKLDFPTKKSSNNPAVPTPTPIPSPTPTQKPESSPTPTTASESPTSTPTPAAASANTPTPKPTKKPTPTPTPTPKPEVLGEESEAETTFLLSELDGGPINKEEKEEKTEKQKKNFGQWLPQMMIGGGLILIGMAAFPFVYPKLKSKLRRKQFDQDAS